MCHKNYFNFSKLCSNEIYIIQLSKIEEKMKYSLIFQIMHVENNF